MGQPTGQRIQLLTFSGSVYVNTKSQFNSSSGVPTQAGSVRQEISGNTVSDAATVRVSVGSAATGILTLTGQPLNTERVNVGTKSFQFQTALTDIDGNVLIGATASDSLDNLLAAISLGAGSGTLYAASTVSPGEITAIAGPGDTIIVTSVELGTGGNLLASTSTLTSGSWGSTTLTGGLDAESFNGNYMMEATTD